MAFSTGRARVLAYVSAIVIIAPIMVAIRMVPTMLGTAPITAGAAAPVLLLAVLIVARKWGTGPGLVASLSAAGVFSYYFLVPTGANRLEDPNDWAAFISFTVTAILVGELAARAERRHLEAQAGRLEIERLYQELQSAFDRASEAEAARRNEQLKAALLDALTHNLRTPLTAIKAAVTALLGVESGAQAALSTEGRGELLQVIDEESDRLNRFIEGLSAADRPDPSAPPGRRAVALNDILDAGLARAETVTRHHHVEVSVDEGIPTLSVDAPSVAEVIYILLDNASKYSPAETVIRVAVSRDDERHVRLAISDEGPGIPQNLREKVFEKFFRVPDRAPLDPRRATGVGLGLPIARRLVEAQAGRIWIETPVSGRGTCVVLSLPLSADSIVETASDRYERAAEVAAVVTSHSGPAL